MTAPCAIEYILVTRWRGGKKGGQNRVCACDTRDRGINKKLKPEHPSETVVMHTHTHNLQETCFDSMQSFRNADAKIQNMTAKHDSKTRAIT